MIMSYRKITKWKIWRLIKNGLEQNPNKVKPSTLLDPIRFQLRSKLVIGFDEDGDIYIFVRQKKARIEKSLKIIILLTKN